MTRRAWLLALCLALPLGVAGADTPRIAIIIDDLGDNGPLGDRFVRLPGPVAGAFLPSSPHTQRLAQAAHAAGKEVLVHLPMEATRRAMSHPDAITLNDSRQTLQAIVQNGLDAVPHAVGLNNHQGSAVTEANDQMQWLMETLRDDGRVFFVDSMTSGRSVALKAARQARIPSARRDVFLDNTRTRDAIHTQFQRLLRLARSRGSATAIGHPYPETLAYLEEHLPQLASVGVELVPVQALLRPGGQAVTRVAQAPSAAPVPAAEAQELTRLRQALQQAQAKVQAQQSQLEAQAEQLAARAETDQARRDDAARVAKLEQALRAEQVRAGEQLVALEQAQSQVAAAEQRARRADDQAQAAQAQLAAAGESTDQRAADAALAMGRLQRERDTLQTQLEALQARASRVDAQQAQMAAELAQLRSRARQCDDDAAALVAAN